MENSNQIQQEGFSAYQIGVLSENNPYTGPEADMWLLGWEDAREQYYATQEELYGHLWNDID